MELLRQQYIDERCGDGGRGHMEGVDVHSWGSGFFPRAVKEPVRNCSQVDRHLSHTIASTIAERLLQTQCMVPVPPTPADATDTPKDQPKSALQWNLGGMASKSNAPPPDSTPPFLSQAGCT